MTAGPHHADLLLGSRDELPRLVGFVTGMSRAGTQWMCKCLNEHSQVAAFGESMFFGRRFVLPAADGRYHAAQYRELRRHLLADGTCILSTSGGGAGSLKRLTRDHIGPLVDGLFHDAAPPMTPGEAFTLLAGAIAQAEGKPLAIEKTPHHLNWIDRILAYVPDARFVVMVREPYSFMLSYKHQGDRKDERVRLAFARRYHPMAAALIWRTSMHTATEAAARHAARTLLVRFDDLQRDAPGTLERVQRFLGLPVEPIADRVPPDNTSFPRGIRPELMPEDLFWMRLIAGRAMRRHGWAPRATPLAPVRIAWSILRLPWWAICNYLDLRTRVGGSTLGYLYHWLRPRGAAAAGKTVSPGKPPGEASA